MLLELDAITKSYDRQKSQSLPVLSGVEMQVAEGEFLCIMGTSGSGKSTLLHILGTLLQPDSGRYIFHGREIHSLTDNDLAWLRAHWIGYVFQTFDLIPDQTVRENVALPYLYRDNISTKQMNMQVDRAIEIVGLSHRKTHRPFELSGGEMQRTAIARAVAAEPKLILADEPTGNLDEDSSAEIMELFKTLNDIDSTIILVTHDRQIADQTSRTLTMKNGRLSAR